MNQTTEAKFVRGVNDSITELHYQIDGNNRVTWQELPAGEKGVSARFLTVRDADNFIASIALMKGYALSIDLAPRPDWRIRDLAIMHTTGKIPRWAAVSKADSF